MEKIYSLCFAELKMKDTLKKEVISRFKSFYDIYNSKYEKYEEYGFSKELYEFINKTTLNKDELFNRMKRYDKLNIKVINYLEDEYPSYLKEIPDPPMVIYVKGDSSIINIPAVAIVGARDCTEYGYSETVKLAEELAKLGIPIISGMAMGIDAAAHYGAMKSGKTIAVLGSGVNECYPASNYAIYKEILEKGCIVSEYDVDVKPRPYHFPRRNRIISGMATCIVVTEANIKSGSLITAKLGLEYGRDICAIPGNINRKLSLGTNSLIKSGAKCIMSVEDIIEELPLNIRIKYEEIKKNTIKNNYELAQQERIVYAYVSQEPILLEKIVNSTQLSYREIYKELSKLEIRGLIKRLPGERYVRV